MRPFGFTYCINYYCRLLFVTQRICPHMVTPVDLNSICNMNERGSEEPRAAASNAHSLASAGPSGGYPFLNEEVMNLADHSSKQQVSTKSAWFLSKLFRQKCAYSPSAVPAERIELKI